MRILNIVTGAYQMTSGRALDENEVQVEEVGFALALQEHEPIDSVLRQATRAIRLQCQQVCKTYTIQSGTFAGATISIEGEAKQNLIGTIATGRTPAFWVTVNGRPGLINPNRAEIEAIALEVANYLESVESVANTAVNAIYDEAEKVTPDKDLIRNYPSTIVWP